MCGPKLTQENRSQLHGAWSPGIGCICFDEFHERSIESDLGFTLCLDMKRRRRLAARMIMMSATFGALAEQLQGLLGTARSIISEGRCFPVKVYHRPVLKLENWEPQGVVVLALGLEP